MVMSSLISLPMLTGQNEHVLLHLLLNSKKIALNTAKNLIQSGDINKSLRKSVQDSKRKLVNVLNDTPIQRKRKK